MSVFDRLATSSPINRTAGVVTSASSVNFKQEVKCECRDHWKAPPKTKALPKSESFVDLTGKKVGRFTVVGFLGKKTPNAAYSRWLVRCTCGDYEALSSRAIKRGVNPDECCELCNQIKQMGFHGSSRTVRS
ncbi:hypothetical protein ACSMXM_05585 [Pacificimonas sp. ICDLI1SI03]